MQGTSNIRAVLYDLEGELACIEADARYYNSQIESCASELKNDVAKLCNLLLAHTCSLTESEIATWEANIDHIKCQIAGIYDILETLSTRENDET